MKLSRYFISFCIEDDSKLSQALEGSSLGHYPLARIDQALPSDVVADLTTGSVADLRGWSWQDQSLSAVCQMMPPSVKTFWRGRIDPGVHQRGALGLGKDAESLHHDAWCQESASANKQSLHLQHEITDVYGWHRQILVDCKHIICSCEWKAE